MLRELMALVEDPSHEASRLAVRVGLIVAALGLAWTALCVGIVFGCGAVYVWLTPHFGRAGALGVVGGATVLLGLAVVLLYGAKSSNHNRSDGKQSSNGFGAVPEMVNEVVAGYPLESVAAALAAGLVASSVDLSMLMREVAPMLRQFAVEATRKS